jgi:CHAD domain-containing protein
MAKAKPIEGLELDTRYSEAAARILEVRAGELLAHSDGVLDMHEIENLHDMRVATRRLRAALEIFAPCLERGRYREVLKEVKAIADALGERRDRDVAIEFLDEIRDSFGFMDSPGIRSLTGALERERDEANARLVPLVDTERLQRLGEAVCAMAADAREPVA